MVALTGTQIRMARAALRWRIDHLADATGLTYARLQRMERDDGPPGGSPEQVEAVRAALTTAGVVFLDPDGELGVGVRVHPFDGGRFDGANGKTEIEEERAREDGRTAETGR